MLWYDSTWQSNPHMHTYIYKHIKFILLFYFIFYCNLSIISASIALLLLLSLMLMWILSIAVHSLLCCGIKVMSMVVKRLLLKGFFSIVLFPYFYFPVFLGNIYRIRFNVFILYSSYACVYITYVPYIHTYNISYVFFFFFFEI